MYELIQFDYMLLKNETSRNYLNFCFLKVYIEFDIGQGKKQFLILTNMLRQMMYSLLFVWQQKMHTYPSQTSFILEFYILYYSQLTL